MADMTAIETARLNALRAMTARTPDEDAEMDRLTAAEYAMRIGAGSPAGPAKSPTAEPVVFAMGDFAIVTVAGVDEYDEALGPMAPSPGSVTSSDPNIATAEVQTGRSGEAQIRLDAVNPGEVSVAYREGENEVVIPVKIVRRVATSIVVRDFSVQRVA